MAQPVNNPVSDQHEGTIPSSTQLCFPPHLANLPTYVAGKGDQGTVAKLSSNENPYPVSELAKTAGQQVLNQVNRYASAVGAELISALAEHYQLPEACFVTGNGSISVLAAALQAVSAPGKNIVYAWRSFEAYPILTTVAGAQPVEVPLTATGEHDLPALLAAINQDTAAVILCSPNNPTGTVLSAAQISWFLEQVPPQIPVFLDEAYIEFELASADSDGVSGVDLLRSQWAAGNSNLVLFRTFSKAYGLAGLRVGYAIAHPQIIAQIQKVTIPFSLNAVGQAAAVAVLADTEKVFTQLQAICRERDRVVSVLQERGWQLPVARGNFCWFNYPPAVIDQLVAACELAGISTRRFPEGLRVSIGLPADNDLFLAAIAGVSPDFVEH